MISAFKEYLLRRGAIKPPHVSFYLKWVSACYEFLEMDSSAHLSIDQKKQFLAHLSKRYENWQVKQADTALRFYDYFLSREGRQVTKEGDEGRNIWKNFEQKMREALKFRHRSLSTEKTYLMWVRRFKDFVGEKQPARLEGKDLGRNEGRNGVKPRGDIVQNIYFTNGFRYGKGH